MRTVKAGRHEEVGAVDVSGKAETRVEVFIPLKEGENHTQNNRQRQAVDDVLAVVFMDERVMGPCCGAAGQQQDQRVDERQVPRIEHFDPCRRPGAVDCRALRTHRIKRVLEEAPEPGGKEHHFGNDEQDEAIPQADHHDRRVIPGVAFDHDIRPPSIHDIQNADQAGQEDPGPAVIHPQDCAHKHDKRRDPTHEGPDRRRQDVVIMVLFVRHGMFPQTFPFFTAFAVYVLQRSVGRTPLSSFRPARRSRRANPSGGTCRTE